MIRKKYVFFFFLNSGMSKNFRLQAISSFWKHTKILIIIKNNHLYACKIFKTSSLWWPSTYKNSQISLKDIPNLNALWGSRDTIYKDFSQSSITALFIYIVKTNLQDTQNTLTGSLNYEVLLVEVRIAHPYQLTIDWSSCS